MITASRLMGSRLGALDGNVGRVRDVLFEDDSWRVRWLVVRLVGGRRVLLAPAALGPMGPRGLTAALPAAAVRLAPAAEDDPPVARRGEGHLAGLFRRPAPDAAPPGRPCDRHLQSCREIVAYAALAGCEPLGPVRDLLIDDRDWTVAALLLGGGRWGFGRASAVAVRRIRTIDWEDGTVRLRPGGGGASDGLAFAAGGGPGMSPPGLQPEREASMIHT